MVGTNGPSFPDRTRIGIYLGQVMTLCGA